MCNVVIALYLFLQFRNVNISRKILLQRNIWLFTNMRYLLTTSSYNGLWNIWNHNEIFIVIIFESIKLFQYVIITNNSYFQNEALAYVSIMRTLFLPCMHSLWPPISWLWINANAWFLCKNLIKRNDDYHEI